MFEIDLNKLFLPYFKTKYNLDFLDYVTNIYFSINNNNKFCGIRYIFSKTDLFRKFERDMSKHKDFIEIVDSNDKSIVIIFKSDKNIQESLEVLEIGACSKIPKDILIPYCINKSKKEILEDKNIRIITKDIKLRNEFEEFFGVALRKDAELSSLIDETTLNFNYE